jgi:hypothetical protein
VFFDKLLHGVGSAKGDGVMNHQSTGTGAPFYLVAAEGRAKNFAPWRESLPNVVSRKDAKAQSEPFFLNHKDTKDTKIYEQEAAEIADFLLLSPVRMNCPSCSSCLCG